MGKYSIEEIKKMLAQDGAKPSEVKAVQEKPRPEPSPEPRPEPKKKEVKLSDKEFRALVDMAKKKDVIQEMPVAPVNIQVPQPVMNPIELSSKADDYADIIKQPVVLYFDTDRTCSLVQPKIGKDGSVKVHDRMFDFTQGQPNVIKFGGKRGSKSHPFYIIKYDSMKPIDLVEYPPSNPTPEETTRLVDLRTLETLSQIAGARMKRAPIIIMMLAAFFGGVVLKLVLGMTGIW